MPPISIVELDQQPFICQREVHFEWILTFHSKLSIFERYDSWFEKTACPNFEQASELSLASVPASVRVVA